MSAALRYNHNSMDEMDEIRLRLRISKLEAKLTLAEIEATALTHEIASPRTPAHRCDEATAHRDGALAAANALRAELDTLRHSFSNLARH
jgi:hypothetical protein